MQEGGNNSKTTPHPAKHDPAKLEALATPTIDCLTIFPQQPSNHLLTVLQNIRLKGLHRIAALFLIFLI